MEHERLNALRQEEQREREHAERQQRFAKVLKQQIQANEEERLIEYERKREESRLGNLNSIAQMEAELEKQKERQAEKVRARSKLLECNEQLKHFKAMEKEEDRIMDIRSGSPFRRYTWTSAGGFRARFDLKTRDFF